MSRIGVFFVVVVVFDCLLIVLSFILIFFLFLIAFIVLGEYFCAKKFSIREKE